MLIVNIIKNHELFRAAKKNDVETLKKLFDQGININIQDKHGMTPLMWATYYCHLNIVEFLLDNGADVHSENNFGETALSIVDKGLYPEIGELLKERGGSA